MSDEKGMGARGWLRTIAGGVRELAEIGAESLANRVEGEVKTLVDRFDGEVMVDLDMRRLGLSDRMVERLVRLGAKELDDFELLDFGWAEDAYRVRAQVQANTVVVHVMPQSAGWSEQKVRVQASTPTPPSLEARPVASWFVANFVELLGGTSFAASVFARALPDGLRWDGCAITWERPLDLGLTGLSAALIGGATVTATLSHDTRGLWISLDGALPTVLALSKAIVTRLGARVLGVVSQG